MYRMQLGLAVTLAAGAGGWWSPAGHAGATPVIQGTTIPEAGPLAPWIQGDPADSVYRVAREALNRREYPKAADLFARIAEKYPRSGYAPDALYWQAFALYRQGESRSCAPRSTRSAASVSASRARRPRVTRPRWNSGSRACSPEPATRGRSRS
jgi:hypothetical protein